MNRLGLTLAIVAIGIVLFLASYSLSRQYRQVLEPEPEPEPTPAIAEFARLQIEETGDLGKTMTYFVVHDKRTNWDYLVVDRMNSVTIVPLAPQGDFMPDPDEQPINLQEP